MDGVLAREAGEPARAVSLLEGAIEQQAIDAANPIAAACCLYWTAHLVLALAAVGRLDEARQHFERCQAFLHAVEERTLLERCVRAIG